MHPVFPAVSWHFPCSDRANCAAEFFGGLFVLLGFITRLSAAGISIVMLVAMFTVHLPNGFFLKPEGVDGIEFVFVLLLTSLHLVAEGGGDASIDRILKGKIEKGALKKLL